MPDLTTTPASRRLTRFAGLRRTAGTARPASATPRSLIPRGWTVRGGRLPTHPSGEVRL